MAKQALSTRAPEQLHKLPGMPEHSEASRLNHRGGLPNRPFQNRPRKAPRAGHGHREPKVLAGWQNAIARFFSRGSK
jgi:hypothetical protein